VKPLDPRLLGYAAAARTFLVIGAVLGVVQTACVIAVAWSASRSVVAVVDGRGAPALTEALVGLALAVIARSLVSWALEAVAARTAAVVKSQLRRRVVRAVTDRGHEWLARRNSARLATLIGPGLDALDDYFAKYLPQLILTALSTPLIVAVMGANDWLSALIVVLTLPLIPVFMVLIGWTTRTAQARQWDRLAGLASSFLDAVNGLSTLKVFGRERRQVARIGRLTDDYRTQTMSVLRVSFLSGFALELAASLSVALVAVSIGIRLVDGSLGLPVALFVLLLAPEAYLPLRQVGANFHAASDGVAAATEVVELLDDADRETTTASGAADTARASAPLAAAGPTDALVVSEVSVHRGGAPSSPTTSFVAPVGSLVAIVGPSGAGKTSLLAALRGAVPSEGEARWQDADRAPAPHEIAWSGQTPGLVSGTVADNIALGDEIDPEAVLAALAAAGGQGIDPAVELGAGGTGLSGGQAQRVALARAVYRLRRRGGRLLLVDEPSSALDPVTETRMIDGLVDIARSGVAVIVVTHRAAVRDAADTVVTLSALDRSALS